MNKMMNEMIDRETFKAIVCSYGVDYEGGSANLSVLDDMVDRHIKNKEHIFELFGNKLKVEKEIETSITESELTSLKIELINKPEFSDGRFLFVRSLLSSLSPEEFSGNVLQVDRQYFNVKLGKGMKVSKALARICLPEDVHAVQTEHSMILQQTKTKGKVVLSIDPIDYVTMSSNHSGWRSCHRLNGGEYRTGPLAYLRDSSSVICYVESSKPCTFNYHDKEYTHSNKTWRQIALVSPNLDYSFQERQYPANNKINAGEVSELFKGLFEEYNGKDYERVLTTAENLAELHIDYANSVDETALYYNDTLHEMYSSGNLVKAKDVTIDELISADDENKPIKGDTVWCLDCGDDICEDSDTLYCCDCREYDEDDDEW